MDQQALTMKHTLAFEAFDDELVEDDDEEFSEESFEEELFDPDVVILDTSGWKYDICLPKYFPELWLKLQTIAV